MNRHPQIEITVYDNRHSYKSEWQQNVEWLQTMLPVIMNTEVMITDELYLALLEQSVSICLS